MLEKVIASRRVVIMVLIRKQRYEKEKGGAYVAPPSRIAKFHSQLARVTAIKIINYSSEIGFKSDISRT